jgi:hypothetical protein
LEERCVSSLFDRVSGEWLEALQGGLGDVRLEVNRCWSWSGGGIAVVVTGVVEKEGLTELVLPDARFEAIR